MVSHWLVQCSVVGSGDIYVYNMGADDRRLVYLHKYNTNLHAGVQSEATLCKCKWFCKCENISSCVLGARDTNGIMRAILSVIGTTVSLNVVRPALP